MVSTEAAANPGVFNRLRSAARTPCIGGAQLQAASFTPGTASTAARMSRRYWFNLAVSGKRSVAIGSPIVNTFAVPGTDAENTAQECDHHVFGEELADYGMPMQVAGKPMVDRANRAGGFYKIVSPSYFTTLKLQMIRSRALSDRDTKSAPRRS